MANAKNKANIIHWSLIKYKRITCNVLVANLYKMGYETNIGAVIKTTLKMILGSAFPLILYTDSKFLYNYLVKLLTIQEKRLMIYVMSLYQSYKWQEVTKIKWIHGHHNLADFMTKIKLLSTLKNLINTNCINISFTEWIKWASII